jgi:hypothetical protein
MLRRPADVDARVLELHRVFAAQFVGLGHEHYGSDRGTTPVAAPQATQARGPPAYDACELPGARTALPHDVHADLGTPSGSRSRQRRSRVLGGSESVLGWLELSERRVWAPGLHCIYRCFSNVQQEMFLCSG